MTTISRRTLLEGRAIGALGLSAFRAAACGTRGRQPHHRPDLCRAARRFRLNQAPRGWRARRRNRSRASRWSRRRTSPRPQRRRRRRWESMIELDGASLLFPTWFGYFDPFHDRGGEEISPMSSSATRPRLDPKKHRRISVRLLRYLDQGHYVNGIAAGLSTTSNKIGYIAAKPIALVLRNVNAFTRACARSTRMPRSG